MGQRLLSYLLSLSLSNLWDRQSDRMDKLIVVWYRIGNTIKIMGFFNDWTEANHWGETLAAQRIIDEYRVYKLISMEQGE